LLSFSVGREADLCLQVRLLGPAGFLLT
jgi:hypothetical protein